MKKRRIAVWSRQLHEAVAAKYPKLAAAARPYLTPLDMGRPTWPRFAGQYRTLSLGTLLDNGADVEVIDSADMAGLVLHDSVVRQTNKSQPGLVTLSQWGYSRPVTYWSQDAYLHPNVLFCAPPNFIWYLVFLTNKSYASLKALPVSDLVQVKNDLDAFATAELDLCKKHDLSIPQFRQCLCAKSAKHPDIVQARHLFFAVLNGVGVPLPTMQDRQHDKHRVDGSRTAFGELSALAEEFGVELNFIGHKKKAAFAIFYFGDQPHVSWRFRFVEQEPHAVMVQRARKAISDMMGVK